MFKELRNIEKREDGIYILNRLGHVAMLPLSLENQLYEYAEKEELPTDAPEFIYELADIGLLEYKNYKPNTEKLYFDDSILRSQDDKPVYKGPIIAHLAITNACNMNCKYCSVKKMHSKIRNGLTTEEYKNIIDKLVEIGTFQIGLTGGEPTTRKDLVELVKYIADKKVACNLTTNGYKVSEELIIKLKEAGLTQVQISLDSYKKEVHEKYRTEGSFDRAIETARLFKKHGFIVGVDTVVTNNNLEDIEKFMEFLEKNNFDGLTIIKLKQGYLNLETFKEQLPEYNKYAELIDKICKRKGKLEVTIDCSSVNNLCKTLTLEEQNKIHSAGCPAGHTLISIAPNGDIYPCAALTNEKYKIGNMLIDNLEKIWNENETLKKLRGIKNHIEGKCKKCPKLDVCRGGCRGISDSLNEKQYYSDINCKYL
ncbi:MAG: radical SAM protein [Candidatus Scatovivens sp.]